MTASCGRLGFDGQSAAPDGNAPGDTAPAQALACNDPQRFQIGAGGIEAMTAVATPAGYAVLTVDHDGNLAGWSYEWGPGGLAATTENLTLDSDITDSLGGQVIGTDLVVAAIRGRAAASGTAVYPLTGSVAMRAPIVRHPELAGDVDPLAGSGLPGGDLAIITVDAASRVDARHVSPAGAFTSPPVELVDGALLAHSVSIQPAATGYVAAWSEGAASPNALRIALLDGSFGLVHGPVTLNTSAVDPANPHVVWADASQTYLVSWHEKNANGGDDVWFQLRSANLVAIAPAMVLAEDGFDSMITTDGTDFWVAWMTHTPADHLEGAHVTATGTITPRSIASSGGTPGTYALIERDRQPAIVWTELGGNGPDLWLAALCP